MQTWAAVTIGGEFNRLCQVINRHAEWHPLFCCPEVRRIRQELGRIVLANDKTALFAIGGEIDKRVRATKLGLDLD